MLLPNSYLIYILIQIYTFINPSTIKDINNFRFLNESNLTNILSEINETNILSEINATNILSSTSETNKLSEKNETNTLSEINETNLLESNITLPEINKTIINETNDNKGGAVVETNETKIIDRNCSSFSDCFNCTINKYCRWSWDSESCFEYIPFDGNYSIPLFNNSLIITDTSIINPFINFLRKTCFKPYTPYIGNNSSLSYNNISKKYCGPHEITTNSNNFINEFQIELNNISEIYGVPNILCEYIILSGPNSFEINIEINEKYNKNFYLLYSENSIYFSDLFKESTTITVANTGRRSNTFIYYSLKSFTESPFKITFKEVVDEGSSQTTGYILIALIILIFILIVASIIYIRYNSKLFDKNKNIINEEEEKIGEKSDFSAKITNNEKISILDNIKKDEEKKSPETPDNLLTKKIQKQFTFENNKKGNTNYLIEMNICCFDFKIINNINDIYKAKCGHLYHNQCYNKLIEYNINFLGNETLKCVSCQQIIYP